MNNPEYAKIGNKLYKINTDFRVALECNKIAQDTEISENEKALAVIYLLYGDKGLNNPDDWGELTKKGQEFLLCGKEPEINSKEPTFDYFQDEGYIKASFFTDYGIKNIYKENMHWWDFMDYLNGLTDNCVLNRVRAIRDYDISDLKGKELREWQERKKAVELKKQEKKPNKEQQNASNEFYKQIGL